MVLVINVSVSSECLSLDNCRDVVSGSSAEAILLSFAGSDCHARCHFAAPKHVDTDVIVACVHMTI